MNYDEPDATGQPNPGTLVAPLAALGASPIRPLQQDHDGVQSLELRLAIYCRRSAGVTPLSTCGQCPDFRGIKASLDGRLQHHCRREETLRDFNRLT
ncbi:MAG: hypothetical protein OEZ06_20255 [Myxococcales bacterium]|nr:hypothetical protein [Myxococcales bacterium]